MSENLNTEINSIVCTAFQNPEPKGDFNTPFCYRVVEHNQNQHVSRFIFGNSGSKKCPTPTYNPSIEYKLLGYVSAKSAMKFLSVNGNNFETVPITLSDCLIEEKQNQSEHETLLAGLLLPKITAENSVGGSIFFTGAGIVGYCTLFATTIGTMALGIYFGGVFMLAGFIILSKNEQ